MKDRLMVIDVESIGLHGPSFAVAWVYMTMSGDILSESVHALRPDSIRCDDLESLKWVQENVKLKPEEYNCFSQIQMHHHFWKFWEDIRLRTIMAADCTWPVESNFLSACVADDKARNWHGPYPLLDIVSFRLGTCESGMKTEAREPNELPIHHPLMDARQSARQLLRAIVNDPLLQSYLEDL